MSPSRRAVLLGVVLAGALICVAPAGASTITVIRALPGIGFSGVTCLTTRVCRAFGGDFSREDDPSRNIGAL
jgi:hypothetical protein